LADTWQQTLIRYRRRWEPGDMDKLAKQRPLKHEHVGPLALPDW
jgi:hypothetical protein